MLSTPRNLLWFLPLMLVVTTPLWKPRVAAFLKPRGGYDATVAALSRQKGHDFVMDSLRITFTSQGHDEWIITAQQASTGSSDREIDLVEVEAKYVGKGKEPLHIASQKGKYLIDEQHLILIKDVVITRSASKEQLFSELVHYYNMTKMVVSPGNVDIKGESFFIQAGAMKYNMRTEGYDFTRRVIVDL